MRYRLLAILTLSGLVLASCAIGTKQIPNVLVPPPPDIKLNSRVSDWDVLYYAQAVKSVFQGRAFNAENGDLFAVLSAAGLAGGASIAATGQASASVVATIVTVGALITNAAAMINPALRATVLSEGIGLVLTAEGNYFVALTDAGIKRISRAQLTPQGARFLADINAAIAVTGRLLSGALPSLDDIKRLQAQIPQKAPTNAALAAEVNKENP